MKNKLRILIAEDHLSVREGFRLIIESQEDMEVVGEAGNGRAAVELRFYTGHNYFARLIVVSLLTGKN